jgi:hypothetical protein
MPDRALAQLSIPFAGRTPRSRHASYTGAQSVVHTWTARQSAYLQVLENAPGLNDYEAAAILHFPVSSINSVRNALNKHVQRIVSCGFDEHRFVDSSGKPRVTRRTRWRLA